MKKRWKVTAIVVTALVLVLAITGVVLAQGSWWNDPSRPEYGQGQGSGQGYGTAAGSGSGYGNGSGNGSGSGWQGSGGANGAATHSTLVTPTGGTPTQAESDALVFLREEEKLARDVYKALYEKWGTNVFSNIAAAESTHMASMKTLLDAYHVTDPVATDTPGVFVNPELQKAYTDLVAQGSKSLTDAFNVGVTIENLDIEDLQALIATSSHADITQVAQSLLNASQNHLNAFNRQLSR